MARAQLESLEVQITCDDCGGVLCTLSAEDGAQYLALPTTRDVHNSDSQVVCLATLSKRVVTAEATIADLVERVEALEGA